MKLFALLLAIFALFSAALALKDPICGMPHSKDGTAEYSCRADHTRYSYVAASNECVQFSYGGCGGNDNRFITKEMCEEKCKE